MPDVSGSIDEVSFVDDCMFPVLAPASDISSRVPVALSIIDREFQGAGFVVNHKPGKSECIVIYNGTGAKRHKHDMQHVHGNCFHFEGCHNVGKQIRVVQQYKHVGTCTRLTDSMAQEISAKMSILKSTVFSLKRKLLGARGTPIAAKTHIIQSVVLTRATFQAATWPPLTICEYTKVHSAIMGVYRPIAGVQYDGAWPSDDYVVKTCGVMAPFVMLRLQKLMLLGRIIHKEHFKILMLLAASVRHQKSWLAFIFRDLEWLARSSQKLAECRNNSPQQWILFVHACGMNTFREICISVCTDWQNNIKEQWQSGSQAAHPIGALEAHVCFCGLTFPSVQALAVHNSAAHGIKRNIRKRIDSLHCCACMQHFGTRERVVAHIAEKSKRCRLFYNSCMEDIDVEEYDLLEKTSRTEQSGRRQCGYSTGWPYAVGGRTFWCGS